VILVAGQDLHIIACQRRPLPNDVHPVVGVRWASRPDFGFPVRGYGLRRRGQLDVDLGRFFLPASTSWPAFLADVQARKPLSGPWFPSIDEENLGYLLPVVALADPRTPSAELGALVLQVADVFGTLHASDPALAWQFWPAGSPAPIGDLLADAAFAAALVAFYRRKCGDYLNALALRFEYAVMFGLATDHLADDDRGLHYEVEADWRKGSCVALSDPKHAIEPCEPPAPAWFTADRAPGTVGHPAFANVAWTHPPALSPLDGDGKALPAAALVPRSPAAFSALAWERPAPETTLIGYGPVLYRLGRFAHGRDTAGQLVTPALPATAVFEPLTPGEDLLQGPTDPSYLDLPGMSWPALEGHYHYAIRGVNLLGVESASDARTSVRHHDDIAPASPRVRTHGGPLLVLEPGEPARVPLEILWDAGEDFVSPDVVDFRVTASWTPLTATTVVVRDANPDGALHFDLVVDAIAAAPDAFVGLRLSLVGAEFPIVAHGSGANAAMRVRRVGAHVPAAGATGLVISAGHPTPRTRILRFARRPAIATTVAAADGSALRLAATVPAESIRLYLHLLRGCCDAVPLPGDRWRLETPGDNDPLREAWDRWRSAADPDALVAGSPVTAFPAHAVEVVASAPAGLANLLELGVVAADGAQYVASPPIPATDPALLDLRGNESARTPVLLSTRRPTLPPSVDVDAWLPNIHSWARAAATFAEDATYDVSWSATAGAARYEVWRALDEGIAGAGTAADDAARQALAAAHPEAFALRSNQVFAPPYRDELPGRAPTRAYYRVRAVGLNGTAGGFSPVIGPVYVPDVRPPPPPNLLRAVAATDADRAIRVEWAQAGELDRVQFVVEQRPEGGGPWSAVGTLAGDASTTGRYAFVHAGVPPSRPFEYRVRAVRSVDDPIDPSGIAQRAITSLPSAIRVARAISRAPLGGATALAAVVDPGTGNVSLSWANGDAYEGIAIRRRAADRFAYVTVATLPGSATTFSETVPPGRWRYQVRAIIARQQATTDDVEVTIG
jgi:hypothetical protein